MKYIVVFGDHNATAFVELKSTLGDNYPDAQIIHLDKKFAIIDVKKNFNCTGFQFKLANSLKIGELLFSENNFHGFLLSLRKKTVPLEISGEHNLFSVSVHGFKPEKTQQVHRSCATTLKQNFSEKGLQTKYFEKKQPAKQQLNSTPAEVFLKKLVGRELIVCKASNKYFAFKLAAALNPFRYKKLDDSRPFQRRLLNTPPRISSLLINLLCMHEKEQFLDPFCGSGTLLLAARQLGMDVFGCDTDKTCVKGSIENVDWINQKTGASKSIKQGDATKLNELFEKNFFNGVACEPILLPPIKQIPSSKELEKAIEKLKPVYFGFLESAHTVMKKGARLCVVSPYIRTSKKDVFLDLSKKASQVGFKTVKLLTEKEAGFFKQQEEYLLDFSKNQKIRRMIYVFEKK